MSDMLVYLYAVGGAALRTVLPSGLSGIGDAPVRVLVADRLAAVVSSVDPLNFGAEPLRRNLEDLSWLASTARAHHAVVDAVWRREPVAPLRLATVYVDDDNVRAMLHSREAAFLALLDRVRGRQEWGVKAFAVPDSEDEPDEDDDDRKLGPGAAYLQRKRETRDRTSRLRGKVHDAVEDLHRVLAASAEHSRRYVLQDPRLSGHPPDLALNAAYLVEQSASSDFTSAVDHWRSPYLQVELTGPWAPYSFATLEES
ncbi:MAG TPA: GvpL/GvpF family gas vesicle protein [Pseudonocardia sp.]|jgi:Gas vesicle synthesis protein GvpL/GvpF|nr:GvpL/GvpF family gas vesicle protein [Pseudonocardia sp.]